MTHFSNTNMLQLCAAWVRPYPHNQRKTPMIVHIVRIVGFGLFLAVHIRHEREHKPEGGYDALRLLYDL
jgi:hypothetical protein